MDPQGALAFLIQTLFQLYLFVLLTRFLLQLVQADFYNPLSQMVVRLTQPLLAPLRRLLPSRGSLDTASLVTILILILLEAILLLWWLQRPLLSLPNVALLAVRLLLGLVLNFFFYTILARVILSWVAPDPRHPVSAVLIQLTEPLLGPVRRLLPSLGMLDLSPMLVMFGLYFLKIFFGV